MVFVALATMAVWPMKTRVGKVEERAAARDGVDCAAQHRRAEQDNQMIPVHAGNFTAQEIIS